MNAGPRVGSTCRSCGAPVLWAISEATGSNMPLDPIDYPDGNVIVVDRKENGTPIVKVFGKNGVTPGHIGMRYKSHFVTCPNAKQHRRK